VAIKESQTGSPSWITAEAKMHACLLHRRIVPLVALIPSEQDSSELSGIVTAYCAGGSLGEWLSKRRREIAAKRARDALAAPQPHLLPWAQRLRIALHVLQALEHMHDQRMCHLDLKPGNILMHNAHPDQDADVMVGDFGLSRFADGSLVPGRYTGTWQYMPPEMVLNRETRTSPLLDIWSMGVTLLDLVSDDPPGSRRSPDEIKKALRAGRLYRDLQSEGGVRCEPEWLQLIEMCLCYNPRERPTTEGLLAVVRAQIKLCDHRAKMRQQHKDIEQRVVRGVMPILNQRQGVTLRAAAYGVPSKDEQLACAGWLRLAQRVVAGHKENLVLARQLQLPESLS
jgi:serine/threonine protein kinase